MTKKIASKTNLKSGTNSTERSRPKKVLNSNDVCSIIKSCSSNRVSILKFGDLYVKFDDALTAQPKASFGRAIPEAKLKEEEQRYITERELEAREDQIAMMHLEDPGGLEDALQNGEFDADGSGRTEETDPE